MKYYLSNDKRKRLHKTLHKICASARDYYFVCKNDDDIFVIALFRDPCDFKSVTEHLLCDLINFSKEGDLFYTVTELYTSINFNLVPIKTL